jgi:hypothetical protein
MGWGSSPTLSDPLANEVVIMMAMMTDIAEAEAVIYALIYLSCYNKVPYTG